MAVSPDPVALWQSQQAPAFRLSPAALAAAEREHARLRRGVAAKSATMALALVVALWFAATVDVLLIRLGCLAAAAGYAQVLYALQRTRRGDAALAATDRAGLAAPSLLHYRAALVRERDRFTGRRLWLPFAVGVPGGLLLLLGVARQVPALRPYVWLELGAFAVAMPIAVGVGRRRARRVQARLDDLDALTGCA